MAGSHNGTTGRSQDTEAVAVHHLPVVGYSSAKTHRFGHYRGKVIDASTGRATQRGCGLLAYLAELHTFSL